MVRRVRRGEEVDPDSSWLVRSTAMGDPSVDKHSTHRTYLREFFVDVFGSLVPGFLFTVISSILLTLAALFLWRSVGDLAGQGDQTINLLSSLGLEKFRLELAGLIVVGSYVVGNLIL